MKGATHQYHGIILTVQRLDVQISDCCSPPIVEVFIFNNLQPSSKMSYYPEIQPLSTSFGGRYVHRYGFQGQEQDKEMWEGAVSFKYRVEDARLGKFFSVDPLFKKYVSWSPFQFGGNQVIKSRELEGLEPEVDLTPTVSLSATTGKKFSVRATATITASATGKFGQAKTDLSIGGYIGGLGTSKFTNNVGFDLNASANITGGFGQGDALPQYTLNSDTKSGAENTFSHSLSYGQMVNYNSATNDVTRIGLVAGRLDDLAFSSTNDVQGAPYWGGDTDQGWTGGLIFSLNADNGIIEFGYENFTGIAKNREAKANIMLDGRPYYKQTLQQASLNKASTFLRIPSVGLNFSAMDQGWFQNVIHDTRVGTKPLGIFSHQKGAIPRFHYFNPNAVVK